MTRNRRSVETYAVQAALYAHDYRRAAALLLPRNTGTTLHEFVLEQHAAAALNREDEEDL